ncbi:MAG: hypothetical protein HYX47_23890 [Burkholderiales bacterium]|nr:hypothetical protein [Burkholderiales bacterium]
MKALLAFSALAAACCGALAGAPDKLALQAGPQPSETQARQAVMIELSRSVKATSDFKGVRFISGPRLVTGINFADGREQAWLMCVMAPDASGAKRNTDQDVGVKPYLLRSRDGTLQIVSLAGWKEFDSGC